MTPDGGAAAGSMAPVQDEGAPNPLFGITLKCIAVVAFVAMQTAIKAGGDGVPPGQIAFFRSLFALVPVFAFLAVRGELRGALKTDDITGHFWRGAVGLTAMMCTFFALTRLSYAEWITLSYATPLLTVVFAAIFLHEVVRLYRWTAVLVGLAGIVVVTMPDLLRTGDGARSGDLVGIAVMLVGATFAAVAMIQIRRLVRTEATPTIVVYFTLTCTIVSLLTLPFGWVVPTSGQAMLLVAAGLCGGVGQMFMTACYRYADTATIAPFEYVSLILAVTIGATFFGEAIADTTLAGAAIVVSAGLFVIWRERQLARERERLTGQRSEPRSTVHPH